MLMPKKYMQLYTRILWLAKTRNSPSKLLLAELGRPECVLR